MNLENRIKHRIAVLKEVIQSVEKVKKEKTKKEEQEVLDIILLKQRERLDELEKLLCE